MGMFFPFAVCAVERRATVGSAVSHPGTGGVMGMLGSRKALCSPGGDWGAPCQSGLAFKGLSILSPGVGIMGSGHGSLSGKMIWDHYFCCHGNFVVQCFCISSVFGTCSRWVCHFGVECLLWPFPFLLGYNRMFPSSSSSLSSLLDWVSSSPGWPWTCYLAGDEVEVLVSISLES